MTFRGARDLGTFYARPVYLNDAVILNGVKNLGTGLPMPHASGCGGHMSFSPPLWGRVELPLNTYLTVLVVTARAVRVRNRSVAIYDGKT